MRFKKKKPRYGIIKLKVKGKPWKNEKIKIPINQYDMIILAAKASGITPEEFVTKAITNRVVGALD